MRASILSRSASRVPRSVLLALIIAATAKAQTVAITGGKVYTMTGAPIENGTVVIDNGRITAVGANASVPVGAQVIAGKGLTVYPGLIDMGSTVGLAMPADLLSGADSLEPKSHYSSHKELPLSGRRRYRKKRRHHRCD